MAKKKATKKATSKKATAKKAQPEAASKPKPYPTTSEEKAAYLKAKADFRDAQAEAFRQRFPR